MKKAGLYGRVSGDMQEREGTSLHSQEEACLRRAGELGYEIPQEFIFRDTYSALTLDRPQLTRLRELARNGAIDAVVVFTLDRISRDPVHLIVLQDEFERAKVDLILVTETLDSSDLGKLITYIKGYAAKLEAEKIKERTMRGKRSRVERFGKLPTGRGILYGYMYDKDKGINIANNSLAIVRMVGMWLMEEGISLNEACRRLMAHDIPAPKGGAKWRRSTLGRIMRNPTYAGKTFAFKSATVNNKRIPRPQEEQVELADAVDRVPFTWDEWLAIQKQLDINRDLSPRNQKLAYLLRGLVYCKHDRRKYHGIPMHGASYYRCSGRSKLVSMPPCRNKTVNGKWLEDNVWSEVAKMLRDPRLILAELQKRRESGSDIAQLEEQIGMIKSRLESIDEAETRYLRLYGGGLFSLDKLEKECKRIHLERQKIEEEIATLDKRLAEARELVFDQDKLERVLEIVSHNLATFTFEDKRLALEALSIKVWIDNDSVTVHGIIPIPECDIVSQPLSRMGCPGRIIPLPLATS